MPRESLLGNVATRFRKTQTLYFLLEDWRLVPDRVVLRHAFWQTTVLIC